MSVGQAALAAAVPNTMSEVMIETAARVDRTRRAAE
jgi:hypothetical protein